MTQVTGKFKPKVQQQRTGDENRFGARRNPRPLLRLSEFQRDEMRRLLGGIRERLLITGGEPFHRARFEVSRSILLLGAKIKVVDRNQEKRAGQLVAGNASSRLKLEVGNS